MNIEKLRGKIPQAVLDQIPGIIELYKINTPLRLAHLLSQASHESATFSAVRENLNYSAEGLKKIFPKYFPGDLSLSYARKPELIASRVYASRMGNGDEKTKDGYKFRGRGYIQLTGKSNYQEFGKVVNLDLTVDPDIVASKFPLMSTAWFWSINNINIIADKGATDEVVTLVTKKINGGTIGISDRIKHFKEFYELLK